MDDVCAYAPGSDLYHNGNIHFAYQNGVIAAYFYTIFGPRAEDQETLELVGTTGRIILTRHTGTLDVVSDRGNDHCVIDCRAEHFGGSHFGAAADLADGELRLRFYTKLDPLAAPNTERVNASPAVWDGVAVVPMDNGAVQGLEALQSGKVLWTFETGKANRSSPAIAAKSGLVYFGSRDGRLYALDAKTGAKAWEFATAGPVDSSPWPAAGVIYVGSDDGCLYALH